MEGLTVEKVEENDWEHLLSQKQGVCPFKIILSWKYTFKILFIYLFIYFTPFSQPLFPNFESYSLCFCTFFLISKNKYLWVMQRKPKLSFRGFELCSKWSSKRFGSWLWSCFKGIIYFFFFFKNCILKMLMIKEAGI